MSKEAINKPLRFKTRTDDGDIIFSFRDIIAKKNKDDEVSEACIYYDKKIVHIVPGHKNIEEIVRLRWCVECDEYNHNIEVI